jgi:hypothetical protein
MRDDNSFHTALQRIGAKLHEHSMLWFTLVIIGALAIVIWLWQGSVAQ